MAKTLFIGPKGPYLYKGQDFHTKYGVLKKEDIDRAKPGTILKTNTGKEVMISESAFPDLYRRIRRNAQIMLPKDIAAIIAEAGLNCKSKVLDAGSGSGALACFLAHHVKKVYSYEIRQDFIDGTIKKNIEMLGHKNIVLKNKDIYNGISERNLDCIVFDLPEPWLAAGHASKALKDGGTLVSYSPNITQAKKFVEEVLGRKELIYIRTIEIIEREWEIDHLRARPKFQMLGHTGFLSFARKL